MSLDANGNYIPTQGHPPVANLTTLAEDAVAAAQQISESHGMPSSPPTDPTLPAQANDLDSGGQWIWNTETQAWQ